MTNITSGTDGWCAPHPSNARLDVRRLLALTVLVAAAFAAWGIWAWSSTTVHHQRAATLQLTVDPHTRLSAHIDARNAFDHQRAPTERLRSASGQAWASWRLSITPFQRRHAGTLRISLQVAGALIGRDHAPKGASVRVTSAHARTTRDASGRWIIGRLSDTETVDVLVTVPLDVATPSRADRLHDVTSPVDARIRAAAANARARARVADHVLVWSALGIVTSLALSLLAWWLLRRRLLVGTLRAGTRAQARARARMQTQHGSTANLPARVPAALAAQITLGVEPVAVGDAVAAVLVDLVVDDVVRARRVDSASESGGVQLSIPRERDDLTMIQRSVLDLLLAADPDARDDDHADDTRDADFNADVDVNSDADADASLARVQCFVPDAGPRLRHRLARAAPGRDAASTLRSNHVARAHRRRHVQHANRAFAIVEYARLPIHWLRNVTLSVTKCTRSSRHAKHAAREANKRVQTSRKLRVLTAPRNGMSSRLDHARARALHALGRPLSHAAGVRSVTQAVRRGILAALLIAAVALAITAAVHRRDDGATMYWAAYAALIVAAATAAGALVSRDVTRWRWVTGRYIARRASWCAARDSLQEQIAAGGAVAPRSCGWAIAAGHDDVLPSRAAHGAVGLAALDRATIRACAVTIDGHAR